VQLIFERGLDTSMEWTEWYIDRTWSVRFNRNIAASKLTHLNASRSFLLLSRTRQIEQNEHVKLQPPLQLHTSWPKKVIPKHKTNTVRIQLSPIRRQARP
jgi:hypothetical protein